MSLETGLTAAFTAIGDDINIMRNHVIYAEDYGVNGDDFVSVTNAGTDKSAALQAAVDAAIAAKAKLILPSGSINLETQVIVSGNQNLIFEIEGAGDSTRLLVNGNVNTDGALKFVCTSNPNRMSIVMRNFVVCPFDETGATQTACGVGIHVQHNTGRLRENIELYMENVHCYSPALDEAYFNRQVALIGLWSPQVHGCRLNQLLNSAGAASPNYSDRYTNAWVAYKPQAALWAESVYGLKTFSCIFRCGGGTYLAGPAGAPLYVDTAGNSEGGDIFDCVSNFGKAGVIVTGTSEEPGFRFIDGHVNARDYCFQIDWARKTVIEGVLAYIDDYFATDGTNADAVTNPVIIQYGSNSGSDQIARNNRFDFAVHTHLTNLKYVESLASAGKVYYIYENKCDSSAVAAPFARGFDSTGQHRVYAADNEFDGATIPWNNSAATDYQYEEIQNGRRVIYGVGDRNGATMPGTLETTTIFIDTTDTLNRPPYRWLSGTAWSRDIGAANGDATDPGIAFANNTNPLGFYRSGADIISVTANGSVGTFDASGINFPIGQTTPEAGSFSSLEVDGGISSPREFGYGGSNETVFNDSATSFTPSAETGILTIAFDEGAMDFYFRVSAGLASCSIALASPPAFWAATTGILTGTTGTDNLITVSAHTDGKIYIENRRGSAKSIRVMVRGV